MIETRFLIWCVAAFLAGSVPFGLLLMKLAGKGDVRQSGSGNIGATNVLRTGGKSLGIATLLLDAAKGFAPVFLAKVLGLPTHLLAFVAFAAVLGHVFTPWLRFKGGKGVATALGVVLAYHPLMVVPSLGTFILALLLFRFVSLGSILAALMLVPSVAGAFGTAFCLPVEDPFGAWVVVAWTLVAFLVIQRHHENIRRLLEGRESRFGQKVEKHD